MSNCGQFAFLHEWGGKTVEYTEHSHNLLVDLLVWNGIFFGSLLIAILFIWLVYRIARIKNKPVVFLLAFILVLGVHSMLEFPLEYAYFLLPFSLAVGLIDNFEAKKVVVKRVPGLFINGVFLTVATFFLVNFWTQYDALDKDFHLMLAESKAYVVGPEHYSKKNIYLIDGKREFVRYMLEIPSVKQNSEQLAAMKKVVYRYPVPMAIYRYSVALALAGYTDMAELELAKIEILFGAKIFNDYYAYYMDSLDSGYELWVY